MTGRARAIGAWTIVLASALVASPSRALADEPQEGLAAPPLTLTLTTGPDGGRGLWKLEVRNTGDLPVRVAADPRLLVLEVTPPAGFVDEVAAKAKAKARRPGGPPEEPKPLRCELPPDARPSTDEARELVIPAKRSWSSPIDPMFYCFGARERAALVSGASVQAHFGWPARPQKAAARARTKPAAPAPPFVVAPVGAAVGKVAPAKEIEAAPVTLTANVNSAPPSPASPPSTLSVSMPEAQDAARGTDLSTTVTIANDGDKAAVVLFRPSSLLFTVAGPAGSVSCGSAPSIESPIRELFSTLGVKGRASTSVLITAVCPPDTFDEPGVYRVTPVLDTTNASARKLGIKSWDGTVTGKTPMLLRVRLPRRASSNTARPALD